MQEHEPKKMNKKEKHRFIEEHKEEILADIGRLPRREVLEKWGFSGTTYSILRRGVEKQPSTKASSKPDQVVELSEHERYLILLGWQQAAREFLKRF